MTHEHEPSPTCPTPRRRSRWPRRAGWAAGIVAAIALVATTILSAGITAIFWVPLLFVLGLALWSIWGARRRRQQLERRDDHDVKDPLRAERRPWPAQGVTDDRLPEP